MIPEFFSTWAFWQWVFTILGMIFLLLLIVGAILWWATDGFEDARHNSNHHYPKPPFE